MSESCLELPDFDCEACGECCRHTHLVSELVELYDYEKGACQYLDGDKCTIYDDRPDVCNYRKLYSKLSKYYSPEEYYQISIRFCEEIKLIKKEREKAVK